MAGHFVFAALAALIAAGCSGGQQVGGCGGTAVLITVMPSPTGTATDGGADASSADGGNGDARPSCTGGCDEYLEALRVAIEAATPAACERRPLTTTLICTPSSASARCQRDTFDAGLALEAQIRDYLGASWPEIEAAAVSFDSCLCNFN